MENIMKNIFKKYINMERLKYILEDKNSTSEARIIALTFKI